MNDPVLVARLRAMWDDLDVTSRKLERSAWISDQADQPDARAEMLVDSLWTGLETTLIKEIDFLKRKLEGIGGPSVFPHLEKDDGEHGRNLAQPDADDPAGLAAAWTRYARVSQESQAVLRECLEIIGALAIRNQDLDKRIWYVADELIRECLIMSTGDHHYFLLVHGMEDAFSKTKARILRLRFPEWTIWDLPLAAHELGHVIISERLAKEKTEDDFYRVLEPFVQNLRDSLVGLDPDWQKGRQEGILPAEEAERWAEERVHEFLADAFATYTMGPAYACSAILLRLNPDLLASAGRPSDAQRAEVILSVLSWANESSITKPYGEVVQLLRNYWTDTLNRVNPHGELTPAYKTWLKQLAEAFCKEAGPHSFRRSGLYPPTGEREGWPRAQQWATDWFDMLEKRQALTKPKISSENLRDALNATWFCRLQVAKKYREGSSTEQIRPIKELQEIGRTLCRDIMVSKASTTPMGAPRPGVRL